AFDPPRARSIPKETAVKHLMTAMLAGAAIAVASASSITAQSQPPAQPAPPASTAARPPKPAVPLKVAIVIARFQGEKKTGSLPYTVWLDGNGGQTSLRMEQNVPVPSMTQAGSQVVSTYTYRQLGTNIDCSSDMV